MERKENIGQIGEIVLSAVALAVNLVVCYFALCVFC